MTSICFVHAHPDDESIASGALIAHLAAQGHKISLLTATRGERGEVIPGALEFLSGGGALQATRERELATAVALLGITRHEYLGEPPAREPGKPPRRYLDSGMRWIEEGLAGPGEDVDEAALCSADEDEVISDIAAWLRHVAADQVITYDADGGYGHPDHVALHHLTTRAAELCGIRVRYLTPDREASDEWFDVESARPQQVAALQAHQTQLRVEGDNIRHSGGQVEPIRASVGLKG